MKKGTMKFRSVLVVAGLLLANSAYAFNFGNIMNPSKWGSNNNDDDYYDERYYGGPGGYGPPPGYYGAPGYGYGAPGYGGVPGYGAPGYGGAYTAPAPAPAQSYGPDHNLPDTHSGYEYNRDKEEIARLKERIRKLEEARPQPPAPPSYGGGQPAYQSAPSAPSAYGSPQANPQMSTQPGWGNQPRQQYQYRQE